MERRKEMEWVLKALLAAYVTTAILLLGLSFLLYKLDLAEQMVEIGIIFTYVISALVGGLVIGKKAKVRRYVWGIVLGILYVVFLILISIGVYRSTFHGSELIWAVLACVGGGMVGGMLS